MNFDDLPDSWIKINLGEFFDKLQYGYTASASEKNDKIKLLRITDLQDRLVNWENVPGCEISDNDYKKYQLENGDFVFARTGSIEKAWMVKNVPNAVFASYLIRGKPLLASISPWLNKFIETLDYLVQIRDLSAGIGRSNVNAQNLSKVIVPLPPLNEQKRIVTKIEQIQEKSQVVKNELEKIKVLLKKLRRSLLASAFRGDLTKDWRANHPDIEPWIHTTLEKIISEKPRNGLSIKAVDYQTNVKSLVLTATTSGIFKPEYFKYLDIEIQPDSYLWLKPKDILIQRSNSLDKVGIAAIYTGQEQEFIYPDIMIKVKVNESLAMPEFVHYSLNNIKTRVYYRENATGTAGNMPKINQPTVMKTPISMPPLEEQKEIVRKLEKMMKFADQVEERVKEAEEKLNKFNQSVLAKAFRGELVPQDPNDEPASVLLGKIQQEKSKTTSKKTKK